MSKLKIALQKKGRLNEESVQLLKKAGIQFSNGSDKLLMNATNFPLEVLYLRDDDIPQYVERGIADIGIVGGNELLEQKADVKLAKQLGFSKCTLSLALPKSESYEGVEDFNGKRVATSYPNILESYFAENNIDAQIECIAGSVEIAPSIDLADGVFDIVSSGSTLIANGLKEVEKVLYSQAVLISNNSTSEEKQDLIDQLLFRFDAVNTAKTKKYILLNVPNDKLDLITKILPGMKSPTIVPLSNMEWSSIQSVVDENAFWQVIDQLKEAGAEGILVTPIEKMIL